jgi:16S rRNA (cytosine1402-N4)-methyltransferase
VSQWHTAVMVEEALEWLAVHADGTYVDATTGTGGHAERIAERLETGRLVGIDRDPHALKIAGERLKGFGGKVTLVNAEFGEINRVLADLGIGPVDGLLADLGVSSLELDDADRGFSIRSAGPLDMRMNPASPLTAAEIVNHSPEKDLANLIYRFGEERGSRRIARSIVRARPIRDTGHLATVVAGTLKIRGRQRLHPATKTFLALRIAVNREMEELGQFLEWVPATLSQGGRCVILSYHSLEDRVVKHEFRRMEREGAMRVLTKSVIVPGPAEVGANRRARSAKLRAAERTILDGTPEVRQ